MKFALFHHIPWPEGFDHPRVLRETVEQVQQAEALGYDAAWLAEHHFSRYGLGSASMVLATHLAARTERIRIGTGIVIASIRNPVLLAEEAATLDILSGGRLDLGLGAGGSVDLLGFHVTPEESRERFQELVDMLLGFWTNRVYSQDGKFFRAENLTVVPRPLQRPHPPLYAAVRNPASVEFAASRGLTLMTSVLPGESEVLELRRRFVRQAAACGRPVRPEDLPYFRYVYVAESEEQARRDTEEALFWVWDMLDWRGHIEGSDIYDDYAAWRGTRPAPKFDLDQVYEKALIGTPESCLARLRQLRDQHRVGYFGGNFGFGNLAHERVLRSMELFAREVMPHL
jgi:alkanesulfonate monooxygenase SsuD/methylene tetrahydromethanopterin reductase-like flavin-dependent oxidoreductase (luciferase family)